MDYLKRHKIFIVFGVYLISAILYTYPLVFNLQTQLIGRGGLDGFQYIWNLFSFWYQLGNFQSPFYNQLIFYPIGANLLFSDYSSFTSFIGFPFLTMSVLFMNLIIILGLSFSAFFAYILIYKLTNKSFIVSILGGFIYGFSPTISAFIETQHNYYLIASAFLPLLLLFVIYFIETPHKYLKRLILLSWMLFFASYYFFILYIILAGTFVCCTLFSNEVRKRIFNKKNTHYLIKSILFFIFTLVIILTFIFLNAGDLNNWSGSKSSYAESCNANLAGFITPSDQNFFLGEHFSSFLYRGFHFSENGDTPFYYLGILFITGVFLGISYYWRRKYVLAFIVTFFVIFFFSLGLVIRIGDHIYLEGSQTPFYYLTKLPLLGMIDCPIRFVGGIHLIIAILFSLFLSFLLKQKRRLGIFIIYISFASLLFDYSVSNFSFVSVYTPRVYTVIAQTNDQKTVLELPSGLAESKGAFGYDWPSEGLHTRQLYWQTIYKKPRVGGYISRIPDSTYTYFKTTPVIADLFTLTSLDGQWSGKMFSLEEKQQFIKTFNLGYIIIEPEARQIQFRDALEEVLEGIPYEKEQIDNYLLYRIIQ